MHSSYSHRRRRAIAAAATCTAVAALTAACASPAATADALTDDNHIHELLPSADGGSLLVASHNGLFTVDLSSEEVEGPIGEHSIDLMGLTVAGESLLASGHPGTTGPQHLEGPNVGLIRSDDLGENWEAVSLGGIADFHALTFDQATGSVIGSHAGQLLISEDMGSTWRQGAAADAYDLLATDHGLLMTTFTGLQRSQDDGGTFRPVEDAPAVVLIASAGDTVVGVDVDGTLWQTDSSDQWSAVGTAPEQVFALTSLDSGDLVVATRSGLQRTSDLGQTWHPLPA
ncbi:WD40/YVTN/BNR-like repeat-containing protein [Agrococcus sp. DT81.2]|uniref:WD40/YVTN/BNR-like repeat-containing protein n=1 Tax=Agrococcus sp. DT81.2 TaxID=3393414 RepID=UPI003CE52764